MVFHGYFEDIYVAVREQSLFAAGGGAMQIRKSCALKICPPPSELAHYVFAPPQFACTEICAPPLFAPSTLL